MNAWLDSEASKSRGATGAWKGKPDRVEIETARSRRAELQVDHGSILRNLHRIRALSNGAEVMAVIKGDAYGLGACAVAKSLEQAGIAALAVDSVAEGLEIREAGIRVPIMVIDGGVADNADIAVRWGLVPGIAHESVLRAYQNAACRAECRHPVWLVANVGFNRSGYADHEPFLAFVRAAAACSNLEVVGLYAHMTNAHADEDISRTQVARYFEFVNLARPVLGPGLQTSLFASHGIPRWCAEFPTDWVRPGLLLYGEHMYSPAYAGDELLAVMAGFEPAIQLRARVIQVVQFDRDDYLGYGHCHRVRAGSRLATLAFGFGRGYPAGVTRAPVEIAGHCYPLIGAVGMDALQVDITGSPAVEIGAWATLIGGNAPRITAREVAEAGGLTPYEFLSGLHCGRRQIFAAKQHDKT